MKVPKLALLILMTSVIGSVSHGLVMQQATLVGVLTKQVVAPGSHSERQAFVLTTGNGSVVLRMKGDDAFQLNAELEKSIGENLRCDGVLVDNTTLIQAVCNTLN